MKKTYMKSSRKMSKVHYSRKKEIEDQHVMHEVGLH